MTEGTNSGVSGRGLDEPVPDVVEQSQDVVPEDDASDDVQLPDELPLEADPADIAEQSRVVELGEDDYR